MSPCVCKILRYRDAGIKVYLTDNLNFNLVANIFIVYLTPYISPLWARCVSGWRSVFALCFRKKSYTTTRCACGWFRASHRWCSDRIGCSPSTTCLDRQPARMRCTSAASSRWWSPGSTAAMPPSSVTDKLGQGRRTHSVGGTCVSCPEPTEKQCWRTDGSNIFKENKDDCKLFMVELIVG